MICVSIVSHMHGQMVVDLVKSLLNFKEISKVLVTLNVYEDTLLPSDDRVHLITNAKPKGFGSNHNAAFNNCHSPYFLVLNPDVQLVDNPFHILIEILKKNPNSAIISPKSLSINGNQEDNWRYFPSIFSIFIRTIGLDKFCYDANSFIECRKVDWVSGQFMLFSSSSYKAVKGFDEKYFMYCEDVDICRRLHRIKQDIIACNTVSIIHDAQRNTKKSIRHFFWHIQSLIKLFLT